MLVTLYILSFIFIMYINFNSLYPPNKHIKYPFDFVLFDIMN